MADFVSSAIGRHQAEGIERTLLDLGQQISITHVKLPETSTEEAAQELYQHNYDRFFWSYRLQVNKGPRNTRKNTKKYRKENPTNGPSIARTQSRELTRLSRNARLFSLIFVYFVFFVVLFAFPELAPNHD